jgi:hypothetical protein
MHRRESSRNGATIAPVGQMSMHFAQVPQCSPTGASAGSGKSV